MSTQHRLSPGEFEVLEVLWELNRPSPVSAVLLEIRRKRRVAYTTVMTVLDKLARKGSVKRYKQGKAYFYRPNVARQGVLEAAVENFAADYFGGEPDALRDFLAARPVEAASATDALPAEPRRSSPSKQELEDALL